ncbi:transforming growth factor beta regulator 1 isoform X1 [Bacillus rossius redtenbacheri]
MVFVNASLCDYVAQLQEMVLVATQERRFLLRKLYQFKQSSEADVQPTSQGGKYGSGHSPPHLAVEGFPSAKKHTKRKFADLNDSGKTHSKPKKLNTPKAKKIVQPIPLDVTGRPVFPIVLGGLTVHSLGEVVSDRPDYHSEEFIFPVGFCSTRVYGSLKDPEKKCVYTCKVMDGGPAPRFEIVADSDLDVPLVGASASDCHSLLLQHINMAVGVEVAMARGKGPEFFGFSHPTILNLIQSSPGTRKCSAYKWSKFEVSRTGEQVMEDKDPALNFEALQRNIAFARSHMVATVKEESTDRILSNPNATLRGLLMS